MPFGPLKSGMFDSVDMPAPVKAMACLLPAKSLAARLIKPSMCLPQSHRHKARGYLKQRGDGSQCGCLSRGITTYQTEYFPLAYLKRDSLQRPEVAIVLDQLSNFYCFRLSQMSQQSEVNQRHRMANYHLIRHSWASKFALANSKSTSLGRVDRSLCRRSKAI
jgi:hypothetical protein